MSSIRCGCVFLLLGVVACDSKDHSATDACRPACAAEATCEHLGSEARCVCAAGYTGDGVTCADVDECTAGTDNCAPEAVCENTAGGFTCTCPTGWAGDGRVCVDIDECQAGTDDCPDHAECENLDGSYACPCLPGYEPVGAACEDKDECTAGTDDCAADADCTDTDGGFTCACRTGYVGDGESCADVDECYEALDDCNASTLCVNLPGSYACRCPIGYADQDGICVPAWGNLTFRREVLVSSAAPGVLEDLEVLIEVDTATLIGDGRMEADCADLRVAAADGATFLPYWIEGGCGTTATQVWMRVPALPAGESMLYLYYGDAAASSAAEPWSGRFTAIATAACAGAWTRDADFDGRFPRGAAARAIADAPTSHDHVVAPFAVDPALGMGAGPGGSTAASASTHTHVVTAVVSADTHLPPLVSTLFCSARDLVLGAALVALFDAPPPAGWTSVTPLLGRFPLGAATYGAAGGAETHEHRVELLCAASPAVRAVTVSAATVPIAAPEHVHHWTTVVTGSNLPPYLDVIMAASTAALAAPPGAILMTDVLPPMGWDRFAALDGLHPRGAVTYGGQGGAPAHTHVLPGGMVPPSSDGLTAVEGFVGVANATHTHSFGMVETSGAPSLVPSVEIVFVKKRDPGVSVLLGAEQEL